MCKVLKTTINNNVKNIVFASLGAIYCVYKNLKYEIKPNRAGDPDDLITSNKKAYKELGWKVKYNLKDMIVSDYKFRKKNNI